MRARGGSVLSISTVVVRLTGLNGCGHLLLGVVLILFGELIFVTLVLIKHFIIDSQ